MELVYFLLLAYVGMFIHFIKKQMKDNREDLKVILEYFKNHQLSTLVTFLSVTITIIAFYFQIPEELTFISCIGMGYAGDSVMNKWDRNAIK